MNQKQVSAVLHACMCEYITYSPSLYAPVVNSYITTKLSGQWAWFAETHAVINVTEVMHVQAKVLGHCLCV